ncbi:secretion/conjugation apparatus DotM-related subunit [Marinobacterium jannaschii]|uniref:secretion/conjugation apparatus DotM-related subunit n=1 Tax=Marinobacterium jannaschii TaxID=64970 RepID=UPI000486C9CC|nr:hypothetical protein [Marinobacterium jannaschii]
MAQERNEEPIENLWTVVILLCLTSFLLYLGWLKWKYELTVYAAWLGQYTRIPQIPLAYIPIFPLSYRDSIFNYDAYLNHITPDKVTFSVFIAFASVTFKSIILFLAPILLFRGRYLIKHAAKLDFTRKFTKESLLRDHFMHLYPRVKPAARKVLENEDPRFGPWATQHNPVAYCLNLNLFTTEVDSAHIQDLKLAPIESLSLKERHDMHDHYHGHLRLNTTKLRDAISSQLGDKCAYTDDGMIDHNQLPDLERALWILFLGCISQRDDARTLINELLDQIADTFIEGDDTSSGEHQADLDGIDALYDLIKSDLKVIKALNTARRTHAYWSTAFTSLYSTAKDNYKTIQSRDFIWLKPVNRTLYFAINQIGLERARTETCGIRTHYRAEIRHKRPLVKPHVRSAWIDLMLQLQQSDWLYEDVLVEHEDGSRPTLISEAKQRIEAIS